MHRTTGFLVVLAALGFGGCADAPPTDLPATMAPADSEALGEDLGLGDVVVDLDKADGWGHATTCKPIPELPPLVDPAIVISLDGMTLHLVDRAGTYDRVFPVGVGGIEQGASLTPVSTGLSEGVFTTRTDLPSVSDGPTPAEARWGWNHRCRMWWSDPQGHQVPVFAGLPFIRLAGAPSGGYGIHGPVDNYTWPSGGTLRRGYVSHGCVRMEAADLVELYARIAGHRAPVRIQKAAELRNGGAAADLPPSDRWMLSECTADADCAGDGGFCKHNHYSGRGFCTRRCTSTCPDRAGWPTTFCVADPDDASKGMCTLRSSPLTNACRRFAGWVEVAGARRFKSTKQTDACLPGTEGWVGDRCFQDAECETGTCRKDTPGAGPGLCTQPCSLYCPDKPGGYAGTFCIDGGAHGLCAARCDSNDDCPFGTTCEAEPRNTLTSPVRSVCVPYP